MEFFSLFLLWKKPSSFQSFQHFKIAKGICNSAFSISIHARSGGRSVNYSRGLLMPMSTCDSDMYVNYHIDVKSFLRWDRPRRGFKNCRKQMKLFSFKISYLTGLQLFVCLYLPDHSDLLHFISFCSMFSPQDTKIVAATCTTDYGQEYNLVVTKNGNLNNYECVCKGVGTTTSGKTINDVNCILYYLACPIQAPWYL